MEDYLAGLEGWQAEIAASIRRLVRETAPEISESIKWGQPVFEAGGPVCYIKPFKNHVNFGFWRGAELEDPEGLLEVSGSQMGHVKLRSVDDIRKAPLQDLVRQAIRLNRKLGDPTRRQKS